MKKSLYLTLFLIIGLSGFSQVQNTKLAQGLLLSVNGPLPGTAITSGTPTSGVTYVMGHVGASSSFAASGAPSTANGVTFKADGDAPGAWDGAILRPINSQALNLPTCQNLTNTSAIPTYGHKGSSSYLAFDGVDDYLILPAITAFGTGDFSFAIKMRRNTAFSNYQGYFAQITGTSEFGFASSASGFRFEFGSDIDHQQYFSLSALSASSVAGAEETIAITVSRSTGVCKSYLNGTLKDNLSITLSTTVVVDVTNFILGQFWAGQMDGSISSFQIFNYALDAAGVTYYSNPANHLKAVDQGATGVSLITGNNSTFSGSSNWTNQNFATYDETTGGVLTVSGNEQYCEIISAYVPMTIGKNYKIIFDASGVSGGIGVYSYGITKNIKQATNAVGQSARFTSTTVGGLTIYTSGAGAGVFDNFLLFQEGCVLSLTPESFISPTLIRDYYHSVDIALSGATAPKLVRGELNSWRMNGTNSRLSLTGASDGLTGDVTISFWMMPTSYGTFNYSSIFNNTEFRVGIDNGSIAGFKVVFFSRNSAFVIATPDNSILLNIWNHIVITTTLTGISSIYINGILSGSANQNAGTPASSTTYSIGAKVDGSVLFQGVIEGLQINKGIWSAETIQLAAGIYQ